MGELRRGQGGEWGCNCDFLKNFGIVALILGIFLTSK